MPIGTPEIILISIVIIIVFGSTKLPQLGDGLGRAIKNFKRAVGGQTEIDVTPKKPASEIKSPTEAAEPPPPTPKAG